MPNKGIVLGHHISSQGIKVDPAKIKVIVGLPSPKTQKEVRSFLVHASYYRRFIENFTKISATMLKLLTKDSEFQWTEFCQNSFEILKAKLSVAPILRGPDWSLPFHISTDAFDMAIGEVIGQKVGQASYAIYFISKNMTPTELSYTVTEKEFLIVVYSINQFLHYITGYEVFVHTDHSSIRFLMNKSITNGRVT